MDGGVDGRRGLGEQVRVGINGVLGVGLTLTNKLFLEFSTVWTSLSGACDHLAVFLGAGVKGDGISVQ